MYVRMCVYVCTCAYNGCVYECITHIGCMSVIMYNPMNASMHICIFESQA